MSRGPEPETGGLPPDSRHGRARQLLALSSFAITQPLLGLLASAPGFLVAHRVMPADVLIVVAVLVLAAPAALFALERAAGLLSSRLEGLLHHLWVGVLTTLLGLPVLNRFVPDTNETTILFAAALGVLLAVGLTRYAKLRETVEFMAFAPLLFLGFFFAHADIRTLVLQPLEPVVEPPPITKPVPVVMVIFDELPLTSLLDADGEIDPLRYPAFARLAAQATWFRNATSVTSYTQQAIPTILTGRYPGTEPKLAVPAEHPYNLFSLLAGSHELNVVESQMQLAHPDLFPRPPLGVRLTSLADDLLVLYLHMILPDSLAGSLPPVTEAWRGFGLGGLIPAQLGGRSDSRRGHPAELRSFVASIDAPAARARPPLHFIHSVMPHRPFRYLPSGNVYFPYEQHGVRKGFGTKSGDWWQQEAYQRHLIQLAYVDRLLGELLDRLEQLGLYDEALLILTADHGVGFWPEDNARIVGSSAHPEDILSVPLLIKQPGQTRGQTTSRNVETIDLLPTLAELLGAEIGATLETGAGWSFDGCSVFDAACPERVDKRAYSSPKPVPKSMQELRFDRGLGLRAESLARKLAWFGDSLYAFGPYRSLVAARLDRLQIGHTSAGVVWLEGGDPPGFHDPRERQVSARVSGRLELHTEPTGTPYVAIAASGAIQTVVPAPVDAGGVRRVLAMLPEESLTASERPKLFLVEGQPDHPQLLPLDTH